MEAIYTSKKNVYKCLKVTTLLLCIITVLIIHFIMRNLTKANVKSIDININVNVNVGDTDHDGNVSSGFRFAEYYSDHMVLQMGPQRANIWGYASSKHFGDNVHFTIISGRYKKDYITKVELRLLPVRAVWFVQLDPIYDEGPYYITVQLFGDIISINNVLFGDVWLCSGQSNMAYAIRKTTDSHVSIQQGKKYAKVRYFGIKNTPATMPQFSLKDTQIRARWVGGNDSQFSDKAGAFAAVCWFYGTKLFDKLQKPIGK